MGVASPKSPPASTQRSSPRHPTSTSPPVIDFAPVGDASSNYLSHVIQWRKANNKLKNRQKKNETPRGDEKAVDSATATGAAGDALNAVSGDSVSDKRLIGDNRKKDGDVGGEDGEEVDEEEEEEEEEGQEEELEELIGEEDSAENLHLPQSSKSTASVTTTRIHSNYRLSTKHSRVWLVRAGEVRS